MKRLDKRAEIAEVALFQKYDELGALWLQAEKLLTARHIPHTISYLYYCPSSQQEEEEDPIGKSLGVAKIQGKWRICHGEVRRDDAETDWTPIADCSAYSRVRLARHLPKLREEIVAASERFVPKVDAAIAFLKKELSVEAGSATCGASCRASEAPTVSILPVIS